MQDQREWGEGRSADSAVTLLVALLLEVALVLSWSGGFIGIRFAADYAPVAAILLWRSLVSGLLLLPLALWWGPRPQRADVAAQIFFGAAAMAGYLGSFALAIAHGVPTGLVALMTDMLPLIVALLSWPVLGLALNRRQWLGSALGLLGVLVASGIVAPAAAVPWWAYLLPVLGTTALALATLQYKGKSASAMPIHQQLCIQCLSAAAVFAVVAAAQGSLLPSASPGFVGGILWVVFVATFGAWGLYYLALRHRSAARVTTILYLSPPVTMLWAWLMFGEPLYWYMWAGLAISLAGIVIFSRSAMPQAAGI